MLNCNVAITHEKSKKNLTDRHSSNAKLLPSSFETAKGVVRMPFVGKNAANTERHVSCHWRLNDSRIFYDRMEEKRKSYGSKGLYPKCTSQSTIPRMIPRRYVRRSSEWTSSNLLFDGGEWDMYRQRNVRMQNSFCCLSDLISDVMNVGGKNNLKEAKRCTRTHGCARLEYMTLCSYFFIRTILEAALVGLEPLHSKYKSYSEAYSKANLTLRALTLLKLLLEWKKRRKFGDEAALDAKCVDVARRALSAFRNSVAAPCTKKAIVNVANAISRVVTGEPPLQNRDIDAKLLQDVKARVEHGASLVVSKRLSLRFPAQIRETLADTLEEIARNQNEETSRRIDALQILARCAAAECFDGPGAHFRDRTLRVYCDVVASGVKDAARGSCTFFSLCASK